ncbi:MAG: glycerol-3-phosphate dehydrogenase/oxidase, partial [Bacteroidetes bacterium]
MSLFEYQPREKRTAALQQQPYDLLVIGGGATGAGIALDAAARGLRTCLVEKQDFAAGTSSRSTKLIHGGLRYLKQFEVALVREVGRERATVHRLAPHLVVAEKMLLPLVQGGTYGRWATSLGLKVYDILAGVKGDDRRRMLSAQRTQQEEPLLRTDILLGGGLYAEYRTDDARLTLEVMKTAARHGADCLNYVEVQDFVYKDGRVAGAQCLDLLTDTTFQIQARYVVSAAGPWVDTLRQKNGSLSGKRLHLTKGVHIVVPRTRLPLTHSVYFDVPDGRMLFAIPRGRVTYIGTTDTDYQGSKEHPRTLQEDVDYLLHGANDMFPEARLKGEDVVSSWAGLRPLIHEEGKSASELSRKDEIFVSDTGLISIAGGKLTGYRKMAQRVVDRVVKIAQDGSRRLNPCQTHKIVLEGGDFAGAKGVAAYQEKVATRLSAGKLEPYFAWYLVHTYGRQTDAILDRWEAGGDLSEAGLILAELWFGVQHEMVMRAEDFFIRRTGRVFFDIESVRTHREAVLAAL